jgi:hypothetical protein
MQAGQGNSGTFLVEPVQSLVPARSPEGERARQKYGAVQVGAKVLRCKRADTDPTYQHFEKAEIASLTRIRATRRSTEILEPPERRSQDPFETPALRLLASMTNEQRL